MESVGLTWDLEIVLLGHQLQEDAVIRTALVQLAGGVEVARPEPQRGRQPGVEPHHLPDALEPLEA